jgi:WD40 repeat protein
MLAAGGRTGLVRVWDRQDGKVLHEYPAHRQRIRDLAFSPDGKELVSCGDDRRVHVRALKSKQGRDLPPLPAKVYAIAFWGPNQLATGGSDNVIRLWNLSGGVVIGELSEHDGSVADLASDGDVLVSGSYDTTIRVWDLKGRVAEVPERAKARN